MTASDAQVAGGTPCVDAARNAWLQRVWVGASAAVKRLRSDLARCAGQAGPVLISGEKGTGCTHAARELFHFARPHAGWHVVTPGAGTSTQVARAEGGLLLRDIEAFSPEEQDWLAEYLQQGVASTLRLFATSRLTHRQLQQEAFLNPALSRLFVTGMLEMPPLRARLDDIPELCRSWEGSTLLGGCTLSPEAIAWCQTRKWPGNIRQLRHVIGHAARAKTNDEINHTRLADAEAASLAGYIRTAQSVEDLIMRYVDVLIGDGLDVGDVYARVIAKVERPMIQRIMQVTHKNQLRAAQILGLNRNTLRKKLRMLDITLDRTS